MYELQSAGFLTHAVCVKLLMLFGPIDGPLDQDERRKFATMMSENLGLDICVPIAREDTSSTRVSDSQVLADSSTFAEAVRFYTSETYVLRALGQYAPVAELLVQDGITTDRDLYAHSLDADGNGDFALFIRAIRIPFVHTAPALDAMKVYFDKAREAFDRHVNGTGFLLTQDDSQQGIPPTPREIADIVSFRKEQPLRATDVILSQVTDAPPMRQAMLTSAREILLNTNQPSGPGVGEQHQQEEVYEAARHLMSWLDRIGKTNCLLLTLTGRKLEEAEQISEEVFSQFKKMVFDTICSQSAQYMRQTHHELKTLDVWCTQHSTADQKLDMLNLTTMQLIKYIGDQKHRGQSVALHVLLRLKWAATKLGMPIDTSSPFVKQIATAKKFILEPKTAWSLTLIWELEQHACNPKNKHSVRFRCGALCTMLHGGVRFQDAQRSKLIHVNDGMIAFRCWRAKRRDGGADHAERFVWRAQKRSFSGGDWWTIVEDTLAEDPDRDFLFAYSSHENEKRKCSAQNKDEKPGMTNGTNVIAWLRRFLLGHNWKVSDVFQITLHGARRFWPSFCGIAGCDTNKLHLLGGWADPRTTKIMPQRYNDFVLIEADRMRQTTFEKLNQYLNRDKNFLDNIANFDIDKWVDWLDNGPRPQPIVMCEEDQDDSRVSPSDLALINTNILTDNEDEDEILALEDRVEATPTDRNTRGNVLAMSLSPDTEFTQDMADALRECCEQGEGAMELQPLACPRGKMPTGLIQVSLPDAHVVTRKMKHGTRIEWGSNEQFAGVRLEQKKKHYSVWVREKTENKVKQFFVRDDDKLYPLFPDKTTVHTLAVSDLVGPERTESQK